MPEMRWIRLMAPPHRPQACILAHRLIGQKPFHEIAGYLFIFVINLVINPYSLGLTGHHLFPSGIRKPQKR
jgi:hypothetical protein